MTKASLRYEFKAVEQCDMCGSPVEEHKVLGKRADRSQGWSPQRSRAVCTTVVRCERCHLVFADPQPIPMDLQDHYGVPPESYWKEEYFTVEDAYFQDVVERYKSLNGLKPGQRALDIGAGLGKAMIALERAGFDTYGFEPSKPFRERAIERMGISPDRLRLGDMKSMEYDAGQFYLITFGAVLEHLPDPSGSIAKALRWLAPGGVIHIEVPSSHWMISRIINTAYRVRGLDYVGNISPMHSPYHLFEFSVDSFRRNGERNGYAIAHHEHFVCQTYMPRLLDPLLRWLMKRTSTGMQLSIWLRHA